MSLLGGENDIRTFGEALMPMPQVWRGGMRYGSTTLANSTNLTITWTPTNDEAIRLIAGLPPAEETLL